MMQCQQLSLENKQKKWIIEGLLDAIISAITVNFYESFLLWRKVIL